MLFLLIKGATERLCFHYEPSVVSVFTFAAPGDNLSVLTNLPEYLVAITIKSLKTQQTFGPKAPPE